MRGMVFVAIASLTSVGMVPGVVGEEEPDNSADENWLTNFSLCDLVIDADAPLSVINQDDWATIRDTCQDIEAKTCHGYHALKDRREDVPFPKFSTKQGSFKIALPGPVDSGLLNSPHQLLGEALGWITGSQADGQSSVAYYIFGGTYLDDSADCNYDW